jgi:hypothetical protein
MKGEHMNLQSKIRSHTKVAMAGIAIVMFAATQPALAETPPKAAKTDQSCFFGNQVSGWNRIDDQTIRVTVSSKRQYDLTLMSPVVGGLFQEHIAIKSSPSNLICTGNGLGVSVVTGGDIGPSSYPVKKIALAPVVRKDADKPAPESAPAPETSQAPGAAN